MLGPNQNNTFLTSVNSSQRILMSEVDPLLRAETLSIVGKAHKGTAFIPHQIWNLNKDDIIINTYLEELGEIDNNKRNQGYLGGLIWLENGGEQVSFCRILGTGENAGFQVGDNIISGSLTPGVKGPNPYSKSGGIKGKTYFFGNMLSAKQTETDTISGYNDYYNQLGFSLNTDILPIVTHVIMMPSGTCPSLKTSDSNFNNINTTRFNIINTSLRDKKASNSFGNSSNDNFGSLVTNTLELYTNISDELPNDTLYINGLSGSNLNIRNDLEVSSHNESKILWQEMSKLNTDPIYQINRGNYLYADFPCRNNIYDNIHKTKTTYSGSILSQSLSLDSSRLYTSFILSGSFSPSSVQPDYENFVDSYKKSKTPWVVSQIKNRENISETNVSDIKNSDFSKLFRFHTYDDGEIGNRFRIRITPVSIGKNNLEKEHTIYSKFNVELYENISGTNSFNFLAKFDNLNLDINNKDFIGRVIGTEYKYYDENSGKIITKGSFRRTNPWIYVELSNDIINNTIYPDIIPAGFEEYPHINILSSSLYDQNHSGFPGDFSVKNISNICQTPLEFVHTLYKNANKNNDISIIERPYWGISFDDFEFKKESLRNKDLGGNIQGINNLYFNQPILKVFSNDKISKFNSYAKYFKSNSSNYSNFWITGSHQNSFFHLEKILISKTQEKIDWDYAIYRRDGKNIQDISSLSLTGSNDFRDKYKYLNLEKELKESNSKYLSFDMFTYGGFDGLDIFDRDKFLMNDNACNREEQSNLNENSTLDSYKKGLSLVKEYSNCTTDILAIPGISSKTILNNFKKLSDTDPSFIELKEINFFNAETLITSSLFIEDKSVNKEVNINDSFINDVRINSNPFNHFDYVNSISKNELIVYNGFLSSVGLDLVYCGPSIPTIKNLALNKFSPLDSESISINENNNSIKFIDIIDKKYSYNNTTAKHDVNLNNIINKGINSYYTYLDNIKLTSSNSTFDVRKSPVRQIYNTRILNSLKKEIRLTLFKDSGVLFSQNSKLSNLSSQVESILNTILEDFRSVNIIKNYYTKIENNHNIKSNIIDLQNYILRGNIYIELYSNVSNNNSLIEIRLQDIISDLSLNSESNIDDKLTVISI